jgi:phage-related minor tail protein
MADLNGFDDGPAQLDLGESVEQAEALADTLTDASRIFSRTLTSGMRAAVLEGRSLESILKSAVSSFLSSMFRAGLAPLMGLLTQGLTGALGSIGGGVSGGATRLVPFAKGGVIGAPAMFPLPGGATGLAGEAGPEAIVPLARGADGALGIAMHGGRGGPPIVINIATPDVESFRRSEAQLTATLARAVGRGRRGI